MGWDYLNFFMERDYWYRTIPFFSRISHSILILEIRNILKYFDLDADEIFCFEMVFIEASMLGRYSNLKEGHELVHGPKSL